MLITKEDFPALVKFTTNIKDADINPFIRKAERTLPTLTDGAYDTFKGLVPIVYSPFSSTNLTPVSEYREYGGVIYRAVNETNTIPTEDNTDWLAMPEYTVFNLAIKPYLVYKAYEFFLVLHGLDITQAGLTQQTGEGFTPISDKRRSEIIASNRSDLEQAQNELFRYLNDYDYLPKPEPCTSPTRRGRSFGPVTNKYR